jgi:ribulose bisphosphate carboxylase small subunit
MGEAYQIMNSNHVTSEAIFEFTADPLPYRIHFMKLPIHRTEHDGRVKTFFSKQGWVIGLELRGMIHPRELWRVVGQLTLNQERRLLERLQRYLKPHDERDPLSRRYGRPI